MKRLAKITAAVVAVIVVLIIVAAVVLPLVFDPNAHKAEITSLIESRIGRQVSIPGDIELSVFPWLGFSVGRVTVANAPGFGDKPLVDIESAEVHVKLLPLLRGDIRIGTISLRGLQLRLARNAKGQTNWAGITGHSGASSTTQHQSAGSGGSGGFDFSSVQIGSVAISDASVSWNDAMTGSSYKLTDFHVSTGHLAEDQPFKLGMGATLSAPTRGFTGTADLKATIRPNLSDGVYKVPSLHLDILAKGKAVPGGSQQIDLQGDGVLNLAAGTFALNDLVARLAGMNISGQVTGRGLQETPAVSGHVVVARFDPGKVLHKLGMALPELQGDDALHSASLKAQFSATPDSAKIRQLHATLDDSTFTGGASVGYSATPVIAFDANVDAFNLDRYLPAASARKTSDRPKGETGGSAAKTGKIDLSMLRNLKLDGKLHVGRLTAYNMRFNDAALTMTIDDGVLTIKPLSSGFYKGNVNVVAKVDASSETPKYSLRGDLARIRFAPLLKDLVGSDLVSALASVKLDLSSSGNTIAAIKKALDGTVQFNLQDGAFHGFNLAALIAAARDRFLGDGSTRVADETGKNTPFNRFTGKFRVHNGSVSGNGMTLDTKYLNIVGDGKYSLLANDLDYDMKVHVDENSGPLSRAAGLTVPIHLAGSLFAPDYSIDMATALKGLAKQQLQAKKDEVRKKVKNEISEHLNGMDGQLGDKLNKKLQEGLTNLFN